MLSVEKKNVVYKFLCEQTFNSYLIFAMDAFND